MAFPHHPPFVKARSLGFLPRAKVGRRGVTIVILLVLVVLLWVAVLAPSAWRRFGERQGVGSIDHFHHQLQLLEHAGPKTVAPAYRLHTALPGRPVSRNAPRTCRRLVATRSWCSCVRRTTRRRPTSTTAMAPTTSGSACSIGPSRCACPKSAWLCPSFRREQARRRCTMLLRCLGGVAISTALIGVFPGMHLAWVFTGLTGLAALGLVGLMAYAKELEAEQARRRSRRGLETAARAATPRPPATRAPGTTTRLRGAPGRSPLTHVSGRAARTRRGPSGRLPEPDYSGPCRGCSSAGRALRSQCRGRGFESLHLHQRPRSEGQGGSPQGSASPACLYVSLSTKPQSLVH